MSQIAPFASIKLNQFIKKVKNRTYQSTSSQPSLAAGDICQTPKGTVTNVTAGTFMGLIILLGLTILLPTADTHASTYSASITAPSSIELNVSPSGSGASVTHSDLTVSSTCPLGYTVSIAGPSDSALYLGGDNTSNEKINASSGTKASPASIIGTGNLNTWGYSPSSSTVSGTFIGLTNITTELISKNSASASGGDTIPVYYGASASPTLSTGAYTMYDSGNTGKITYYLTTSEDCMSYLVHFNPTSTAGGTPITGTGTMDDQRIPENVTTILSRNTYIPPAGYYFTGWNTAQDGTGTSYLDRQQVLDIASVGTTTPLTLYAQYSPITNCNPNGTTIPTDITHPTSSNIVCMQDITASNKASVMASMTEDAQYQLIDKRDQKVYWVSKLKDGNIWMTQNLDLDLFTDKPLTSEDTDLTDHSLAGAYQEGYTYDANTGITTWTPANDTISAITDANTSGVFEWTDDNISSQAIDPGNWYWNGENYDSLLCRVDNDRSTCNYIAKSNTTYSAYFSTTPYLGGDTSNNGTHGHMGNYYNWPAAIASNDTTSLTVSTYDDPTQNPKNSICPLGWRLPVITTYATGSLGANEFWNLSYYYNNSAYNDGNLITSPLFFNRTGRIEHYYNSNVLFYAGHSGFFWSSTVNTGRRAYYVSYASMGGNFHETNVGGNGESVRCLTR